MAQYLVTGGAGFIGSNLCHALVGRGERVRVLDNLSTGHEANIADLIAAGHLELIRGDVTDRDAVGKAMAGVDYVLHQAAVASVQRSIDDPLTSDFANVHGTVTVLNAAQKAKVKRVVYAASSSAYGNKAAGSAKVETMIPEPLSPYAVSKLAAEYYMKAFYASYGLETVALRYFNVFGPRQDPKSHYAAVIPLFVTAALQNGSATIYGDGQQSRDFCFIDNVVEANLLACTAEGAAGETFNLGCGDKISLLQVLDVIGEIVGHKVERKHEPTRTGDIRESLADISKARRILGYGAKVRFPDGIKLTVDWYKKLLKL